ncbi:MAG: hypothetical protein ACKVRP_00280 [Bacteroidota bacterium]
MIVRRTGVVLALLAVVALAFYSCKDMGDEVGGGDAGELTANTFSVSLGAGGQATVTISGGSPPYEITEQPDPTLASAVLNNAGQNPATLVITAPSVVNVGGTTTVEISESHDEDASDALLHGITISITVSPAPALVANPTSVTVGPSQAVSVTISNGTPPYVIDTAPNGSLATASFVNPNINPATLTITGVSTASAAGSTSVKVKDSSPSPEREVTIPITKNP